MNITRQNYIQQTSDIDFSKLSKALKEGDQFFKEFNDLYNDDESIKKAVDNHIKLINRHFEKKEKPLKQPKAQQKKTQKRRL